MLLNKPTVASHKISTRSLSYARDPPSSLKVVTQDLPPFNTIKGMGEPLSKQVFLRYAEESREGFYQVKNYTMPGNLFAPEYYLRHYFPMADLRVTNINIGSAVFLNEPVAPQSYNHSSLVSAAKDPPLLPEKTSATQETPPPNKTKGMGEPWPKWVFLRHTEESREGFGQVKNYTTLGVLFAPEYNPGHYLPMADLRVSNINSRCKINTYGTNVGFLTRYIPHSSCWMWGFNAYWDYRQGSVKHWFQLGAGLELLSKYCDFRMNGYWPLEGIRRKIHTFEVGEDLFTKRIKFEHSYAGFNAEFGWKILRMRDFQIYLAGGPYYLSGGCARQKSWGGSFRIRPQYRDYLAVDLSMSDDSIFHMIYQVQFIFSLPLYYTPKGHKPPCRIFNREIYQPVVRWDLITLGRGTCWESNF